MEAAVRNLFRRYEAFFNRSLAGEDDLADLSRLYAAEFIGAAPAGVRAGKNDDAFRDMMSQGYARYRAMGAKAMRLRDVRVTPIDEGHCVARVAWTATYARDSQPDVAIDFDVHYLVQWREGEAKVFGWITGDEQAVLERHGIV